jgi:putative NADH-flavin reductase
MKVAVVGATGNAGQRIVKELTSRGHQVTAISRNAGDLPAGATHKQVDASDSGALVEAIRGHDAVVSSLKFAGSNPQQLIEAVKKSGVPRYLVVGGAATLKQPGSDQRIIDSGQIPEEWMPEIRGGANFLEALKGSQGLDWTFVSPSMFFGPGERTGKFRLGTEELLVAEDGKSHISYEDYAIALVDELENPKHRGMRFTVGY